MSPPSISQLVPITETSEGIIDFGVELNLRGLRRQNLSPQGKVISR